MMTRECNGALWLEQVRQIQDPIHGTIALTELECRIVDHPIFQRLRSVKQLGNASLVFPSATHTRFAHSLGVMHQASLLFCSLMRKHVNSKKLSQSHRSSKKNLQASFQFYGAVQRVHQRVRLAGLLHDIGHGPYSHHFEHFLESTGKRFGNFESKDLKISVSWIEKKHRKKYAESKLCHEHFSFGLMQHFGIEKSELRSLMSLLDSRIVFGAKYSEDLKTIATALENKQGWRSLHSCLKSLLSSDIDADRIDYLQRDAYFCGIAVSIDTEHLLRSIDLAKLGSRFVIELQPNAVFAVEQLLLARKQMFDQVYQNRTNQLFDELLSVALMEASKAGVLKIPATAAEFLKLTDESIALQLRMLVTDCAVSSELARKGDLAIKMYLTRTLPVTLETKMMHKMSVQSFEKERQKLQKIFPGCNVVALAQKELLQRLKNTANTEVLFTRISKNSEPVPLKAASELIKSSAWSEKQFRLIVTDTHFNSAVARGLEEKLRALGFDLLKPQAAPKKQTRKLSRTAQ
jgi:HD superfamily phosphohydrolase